MAGLIMQFFQKLSATLQGTLAGRWLFCVAMGLMVAGVLEGAPAVALKVGDPVGPLKVGEWIQGGPMDQLPTGQTAVVVFFSGVDAVGCVGLSRLDGMRDKLNDPQICFLGVRVWEDAKERLEQLKEWMGEVKFPLAGDALDKNKRGIMAATWMYNAGERAVPVVFVVNREGRLAWVGHPYALQEKLLRQIHEGTYDLAQAAEERQKMLEAEEGLEKAWQNLERNIERLGLPAINNYVKTVMEPRLLPSQKVGLGAMRFQTLLEGDGIKEAVQLAAELSEQFPEEQGLLNLLAWELATREEEKENDFDLVLKIAERANAAAYGRDANILDTLARALFLKGRKEEAVKVQKQAVERAPQNMKGKFTKVLRAYEKGVLPPANE